MSKLKMLKKPKKPKALKKPGPSASVVVKENYLKRVKAQAAEYHAKVKKIEAENLQRKKINEKSEKLSKVISGIGDITEIRPSSFKAVTIRNSYPRTKKVSGIKRKKTTTRKKAAPKRKVKRR